MDDEDGAANLPSAAGDTMPQLLNRLRLRQVSLLLAIESRRTLRGAAQHLGMTQPAATKMLHELEGALGQPLFERVGRGLKLTAAGHLTLAHFHGLLGTMEALTRELQALRLGSAGRLAIGSITAASPVHLTDAMVRLKTRYPLLAVEIVVDTSDRLTALLRAGELDVVIGRVSGLAPRGFTLRPIADEALAVIVAPDHPLAGRRHKRITFAALQAFPWILQTSGSPLRDVMEQEFRGDHLPLPQGLIETSSILTTIHLVARTTMVGVVPQSIAGLYERHGMLRVLPYALKHHLPSYGSIVRTDRPLGQAAEAFLALLHEGDGTG